MEKPHLKQDIIYSQLKKHFQDVDKENIGVITQPEFLTSIKSVGVKLSLLEEKQLLKKADPQQSGMVEWGIYKQVVGEFIQGLQSKKQAEAKLSIAYQQQVFSSILALVNDQSQDVQELMIQKFKEKDEDQTGTTNISQVKTVLDLINKKYKDQKKVDLLTVAELADITKMVTDLYGYKEIPYKQIHQIIINYKIKELAAGRVNSRVNNLEVHLQEIFSKYDEKKNGKIKVQNFEEALKKSQKIKLSKALIYLLKSLISIDAKGQIRYSDNSKFLAEIIKRFYLNSSKKKE